MLNRLGLEALFEDYLRLMPEYQGVNNSVTTARALFGFFPHTGKVHCDHHGAAFCQSEIAAATNPLELWGFGAMVRHLKRLTVGIHEALQTDQVSSQALALTALSTKPDRYLAVSRAMSAGIEKVAPDQINQLLSVVFLEMSQVGDRVLKPFLDVVQFPALTQTLVKTAVSHPG